MTGDSLSIIQPSWCAQLFGVAAGYESADVAPEGIRITTAAGRSGTLPFKQVTDVRQEDGFFWSTITLVSAAGATLARKDEKS